MLINSKANLALSTKNARLSVIKGKLINFQMRLSNLTLSLLMTMAPDVEGKVWGGDKEA